MAGWRPVATHASSKSRQHGSNRETRRRKRPGLEGPSQARRRGIRPLRAQRRQTASASMRGHSSTASCSNSCIHRCEATAGFIRTRGQSGRRIPMRRRSPKQIDNGDRNPTSVPAPRWPERGIRRPCQRPSHRHGVPSSDRDPSRVLVDIFHTTETGRGSQAEATEKDRDVARVGLNRMLILSWVGLLSRRRRSTGLCP